VNLGFNILRDGEKRDFILDRNLRGLFGSHRRKKQVDGENYKTRNFMFWYASEAYSMKLIYGDVLLKCTVSSKL
jgi:hypothetical protein